jgi:hypothetical protein
MRHLYRTMRRLCQLFLLTALAHSETPPKPAPPPTPREIAWRILSGVHLAVGKSRAYVQPYLLLHLAENTAEFNHKLALEEFRDSFTDARIIEPTYRAPLQSQIVQSVAAIDTQLAIDLVRTIRPNPAQAFARNLWDHSVETINSQLMAHGKGDEAIELIKLVSIPGIYPNYAASTLMNTLAAADDRRVGIFGYAATCYRQVPFPGFTTMLQDHWQSMPRTLIVMAASAVADDGSHATTAELRQVLPILREVDPPRAERLLSDHPEIQEPPKPKPSKPNRQEQNDERQAALVDMLAAKNPARALSLIGSIHDADLSKQLILQIASSILRNGGNPDDASLALNALLKLPAKAQRDLAPQLAELAAYAGKSALAEQFVDASFDVAAKLLQEDFDAKSDCGVNPAPRDWWPSTAAYRAAIHSAATVYHTSAERYLTRIQADSDLYLLMSVEFARALLGGSSTVTPRLSCDEAVAFAAEDEKTSE